MEMKKWGKMGSVAILGRGLLITAINLRAEFTVAYTGANLHFWPNYCSCPDNFATIIRGYAVAAPQCRAGTEYAQDSFDATETVPCSFNPARRRGD